MKEAVAVKARAQKLRDRKAELEEALAQNPDNARTIRLELAQVEEKLVDCARELRELMPRHKVSYRTTWAGVEGRRWDQMQYRAWAELEGTEEPDGPTEQALMRQAARIARAQSVTSKQAEYLTMADDGGRAVQIAREQGKARSTVSRTLSRARTKVERDAKAIYTLLEKRTSAGMLVIDLADPDTLRAVLDLLTNKQQVYLYLYYGEWLSLREIGELFGVNHSVVLRSIRAALERLDGVLAGQEVKVRGLDALEEQLITHFNRADLEAEIHREPACPNRKKSHAGAQAREKTTPPAELPAPLNWTLLLIRGRELRSTPAERFKPTITCHWGSGRLLPLLKKRLAPAIPWKDTRDYAAIQHRVYRAVRRCLSKLFSMIRRDLDADNH